MRALGEDMKRRLKEAGVCVCVPNCLPACMSVSVCVRTVCVCVCARVRVVGVGVGGHRAYICMSSCDCGTTVDRVYVLKIRTCNNCSVLLPHLYVFDIRTMISLVVSRFCSIHMRGWTDSLTDLAIIHSNHSLYVLVQCKCR